MTAKAVIAYAVGLPVYVMVKAMTPNFFARCDTKTPVKYSVVVLFANLLFALLLMKPFGHVGIAAATTLAAFVSFYQYVHGLKKRKYWCFSADLCSRIAKIIGCSFIMGVFLYIEKEGIEFLFEDWLSFSTIAKLLLLGVICSLGGILFLFLIKLCGVTDVFAFIKRALRKRRSK